MDITFRLLMTVGVASLASLQFGYHLAELNAPESVITCRDLDPTLADCIPMNAQQLGLVNGMNAIGGMVAAFWAGTLADKFGRRRISLFNAILFLLGGLTMVSSTSVTSLCFGRLLAGLGSGGGIVVTPIWLSEVSPIQLRGFFGTMNQVFVNIGILVAQTLGLFYSNEFEWRSILWAGACFGALNAVFLPLSVESPKWLALSGRTNEAREALRQLRQDDGNLDVEIAQWKTGHDSSQESEGLLNSDSAGSHEKVGFAQFFLAKEYRRILIAVVGILTIQQWSGINAIVFYGVSILGTALPEYSRLVNCFISGLNLVTTIIVAPAVDKYGRRPLLLLSTLSMGVCSAVLTVALLFSWPFIASVAACLFAVSFAIGLGPIPFLIVSELAPSQAAGVAQSVGTTANWLSTFAIGFLFPILKSTFGDAVFFLFVATCFVSVVFISRFIPETKGKANAQQVWADFR